MGMANVYHIYVYIYTHYGLYKGWSYQISLLRVIYHVVQWCLYIIQSNMLICDLSYWDYDLSNNYSGILGIFIGIKPSWVTSTDPIFCGSTNMGLSINYPIDEDNPHVWSNPILVWDSLGWSMIIIHFFQDSWRRWTHTCTDKRRAQQFVWRVWEMTCVTPM